MPAVRLDAVSRLFPGGGGVRGVSLDIPNGEYLVVVGPNAAPPTPNANVAFGAGVRRCAANIGAAIITAASAAGP